MYPLSSVRTGWPIGKVIIFIMKMGQIKSPRIRRGYGYKVEAGEIPGPRYIRALSFAKRRNQVSLFLPDCSHSEE